MILCIEDNYFNPLQITVMVQFEDDVRVFFSDGEESYFTFKHWKIENLAGEINRLIQEYQDHQIRVTLWEMQQSLNRIDEGIQSIRIKP